MDEIGKKLGIQSKDLPRRNLRYFFKIILRYILELLIIIISASMGLYVVAQINIEQESYYPYRSQIVIPPLLGLVPVLFLLTGLNSGNSENTTRRSGVKLKLFRGFSVLYLITMVFIYSFYKIFTPTHFSLASLYGVYKKKEKNLLLAYKQF